MPVQCIVRCNTSETKGNTWSRRRARASGPRSGTGEPSAENVGHIVVHAAELHHRSPESGGVLIGGGVLPCLMINLVDAAVGAHETHRAFGVVLCQIRGGSRYRVLKGDQGVEVGMSLT